MPRAKTENEKVAAKRIISIGSIFGIAKDSLAIVFYLMWIVIGAFFLFVIFGQIKQGVLSSLVGSEKSPATQVQTPTETDLPGVGKVNIECVQTSLSGEAIQKLITEGNASTLTADEKAKLDPCVIAAESPAPSPKS